MNRLIVEEDARLTEDFNLEILATPFRAKGVTKTVVTWYGVTQL